MNPGLKRMQAFVRGSNATALIRLESSMVTWSSLLNVRVANGLKNRATELPKHN
jgi:hypothetical protein